MALELTSALVISENSLATSHYPVSYCPASVERGGQGCRVVSAMLGAFQPLARLGVKVDTPPVGVVPHASASPLENRGKK